MKKRIIAIILPALMLLFASACAASPATNGGNIPQQPPSQATGETASPGAATTEPPESPSPSATNAIEHDREGNPVALPGSIERIISLGPSNTEILIALGLGGKIIAADDQSSNIEGLPDGAALFDMFAPDGEQIVALAPDAIIVTGMSRAGGASPLQIVEDVGICVLYIPTPASIDEIKEDIRFIAAVVGAQSEGEEIIGHMEREIGHVQSIGAGIAEKKSVYFEISAAPWMYSFGSGVFLNEIIELIGASNILSGETEWLAVGDEAVLGANPDVILTSVNYIDDPVGEIMARPGWSEITAIQNNDVHYIDTDSSNRPSHNIVNALWEIARAVYPDYY